MVDNEPFQLAVCGLHLSGQPLNWQLTEVNGTCVRSCKSSSDYKLYAIEGPAPGLVRPGMVKVTDGSGAAIDLEVRNAMLAHPPHHECEPGLRYPCLNVWL